MFGLKLGKRLGSSKLIDNLLILDFPLIHFESRNIEAPPMPWHHCCENAKSWPSDIFYFELFQLKDEILYARRKYQMPNNRSNFDQLRIP